MAYAEQDYRNAAQFIIDNINNPAVIAEAAARMGVSLEDLTKATNVGLDMLGKTEDATPAQVASWFDAQPDNIYSNTAANYVQDLVETAQPPAAIPPPAPVSQPVSNIDALANAAINQWQAQTKTPSPWTVQQVKDYIAANPNTYQAGLNKVIAETNAAISARTTLPPPVLPKPTTPTTTTIQLEDKAEADARLAAAREAIEKQPFSVSGLRNALDVGLKAPPNWDSYSLPQKIAWLNQNKVSLPQLGNVNITDQALIDSYIRAGFKPPGTATLAAAPTTQTPFVSTPPAAPKLTTNAGLLNANPLIGDLFAQYEAGTGTKANVTPQQVFEYVQANPNTYGQTLDNIISATAPAPVTKNMGGPIAFAAGDKVSAPKEMSKYGYKDFGLPSYLDENLRYNPEALSFLKEYREGLPRNVVFNPVLEAAERAEKQKGIDALAERLMMVRQGRTGAEYFPASMFKSTTPASSGIRALYQYAEGGGVSRGLGSIAMKGYAEELRKQGRNGDTMLAHINPQEAKMLEAMGGSGTINPATGLPEYGFSWKKLLKAAQFIVPFIPGIGLPLKVALSGIAGGFAGPGKGFDFKRGLISGAMAFAGGKLAEGLTAAGQVGAETAGSQIAADTASRLTDPNLMAGNVGTSVMLPGMPANADLSAISNAATPSSIMFDPAAEAAKQYTGAGMQVPLASEASYLSPTPQGPFDKIKTNLGGMYKGAENLISGAPGSSEAFKQAAGYAPSTLVAANVMGPGLLEGVDESTKFQMQQALANAKTEEERERIKQLFLRTKFAKGGGISALVAGGATGPANAPRTINGAGDGMSDSVPATIEGVQEARLADGEFVIPADVVADLGNGSSNAGAKQLYAMMDRVRKARHGTTKQPPEVDVGRLMPA